MVPSKVVVPLNQPLKHTLPLPNAMPPALSSPEPPAFFAQRNPPFEGASAITKMSKSPEEVREAAPNVAVDLNLPLAKISRGSGDGTVMVQERRHQTIARLLNHCPNGNKTEPHHHMFLTCPHYVLIYRWGNAAVMVMVR